MIEDKFFRNPLLYPMIEKEKPLDCFDNSKKDNER